ncbi:hypothetical protein NT6N_20970 [Oceaniferula spumae]|uniref:Verru_Chthon cassette protein A n=1 Tax=Oceaniferula spumae TaxID=2979115 RepID=A0AAT9FLR3_9BACT
MMTYPPISPLRRVNKAQGFALIATISVMVLMVMISLATLSLSTLTIRQSQQNEHQTAAETNARMALMLALAELQKNVGPDQRVTATSAIFDTDPTTLEIDDVANPHIVGAWSTLDDDGIPIIERHDDGYLTDKRNPGTAAYNHKEKVLRWLVSSQDNSFDPRTTTLNDTNSVTLVKSANGPIRAPLVDTRPTDSPNDNPNGAYAYHVSDLGVMAPITQVNENIDQTPDINTPDNGGYANLYTGRKRPYDVLTETSAAFTEISSDEVVKDPSKSTKFITIDTTDFKIDGSKNPAAAALYLQHPQSFCLTNAALLTDTLNGGLRIDLTPYVRDATALGSASIPTGTNTSKGDFDPIIAHDRMRTFSPKFGALRDYAQLANYVGTDRAAKPRNPLAGGGQLNNFPDPTRVTKQGFHPIITEWNEYYGVAKDPSTNSGLRLMIYPRITLWNPYNVKISSSRYIFQVCTQLGFFLGMEKAPGSTWSGNPNFAYGTTWRYFGGFVNGDGTRMRPRWACYQLEPAELEPGQAITFMPPNGVIKEYQKRDENIATNILVPNADPGGMLGAFHLDAFGGNGSNKWNSSWFLDHYRITRNTINGSRGSPQAILRLAPAGLAGSFADVIAGGDSDNPDYPIVHVFDISGRIPGKQEYYQRFSSQGPFVPFNTLSPSNNNIPYTRSKMGGRLKAFNEIGANISNHNNAMWNYPLFEANNLHSPFIRRSPWDIPTISSTQTVSSPQLETIAYGPVTMDEVEPPGYIDGFFSPRFNDVAENSPFQNANAHPGELRFILFDIPASADAIFNLAQFRGATLTHEFSAPTFILGESLVNPASPRDQSAYSIEKYTDFWKEGINYEGSPNGADNTHVQKHTSWWQPEYGDPLNGNLENYAAFDYRFETNHALWDRYFFSTRPDAAALDTPNPFPNRHIQITDTTGSIDGDKIAASLQLRNHHSVNSTNLLAWKSLLMASRGVNIPHRNGSSTASDKTPVISTSESESGASNPAATTDAETWSGFRELDDDQINALAEEIVAEVKRRAPFISISDFVNRRLYQGPDPQSSPALSAQSQEDIFSYAGPLEIAIRKANLNAPLKDFSISNASSYEAPELSTPRHVTANMPEEVYAGAPAHISQGKILQSIGSTITARSDTFKIRAYGSSKDATGRVIAEAYCEAIVQRTADFVDPSDTANTPVVSLTSEANRNFGRRFIIQSFRWLPKTEVN